MLVEYEERYQSKNPQFIQPITNENKLKEIKEHNIDIYNYQRMKIWKMDNKNIMGFKPSQLFQYGEYPLSDFEQTSFVFSVFTNNLHFFTSSDEKIVI